MLKKILLWSVIILCGVLYAFAWDGILPHISREIVAQNYHSTPLQVVQFIFWIGFPLWVTTVVALVLWMKSKR